MQILLAWSFPLIVESKGLFLTWVSLTYFCEGGHFTLAPAIYKKLFGDEGVRIFGWGFSFIGIASLLQIVMIEVLFDFIGFNGILFIHGLLSLIALMILIFYFEEKKVEIKE